MHAKNIIAALVVFSIPATGMASCMSDGGISSDGTEYANMVLGGEGGGNWAATNGDSTATGAFQFMYGTLQDLGYISGNSRPVGSDLYGDSDWSDVTWTGLDGVNSREEFMNNQAVQVTALGRFTQNNLDQIGADYTSSANGVPLTPGGVAYASHFLGAGGYQQWSSCGYQASCLPSNILAQNANLGGMEGINDMLMGRLAEGAGVDPSCIDPGSFDGDIPFAALMPWI
ncbi:hypothetical protein [Pseudosulfitobacter pseudonitzschiae]|uniref:hypothetical protein n=1 Tax=Pseudosulfitobacter pseudonitzschiae TaxID=1402135 RepID=UPI003B795530